MNSTSIDRPRKVIQVEIPKEYHDLMKVFSKKKGATELPPHRNYDYAIDFLPGTTTPRKVYPLCPREKWAMEEYVQEALKQKYVIPAISPASAGFFFV